MKPLFLFFFLQLCLNQQATAQQVNPWIAPITSLVGINYGFARALNKGYDVDFDYQGNLYVYGGGGENQTSGGLSSTVAKYTTAGILNWTLNTVNAGIASNFIIDRQHQWCYLGSVENTYLDTIHNFHAGAISILRCNLLNGNYNAFSDTCNSVYATWDFKINCATGKILVFGGGWNNFNFGIADTTSGYPYNQTNGIHSTNFTGLSNANQFIVNAEVDNKGNAYCIFNGTPSATYSKLSKFLYGRIYKLGNNYNSVLWNTYSGWDSIGGLLSNKPYMFSPDSIYRGTNPSLSINVLAPNLQYLFYYDGFHIKAFDAATGAAAGVYDSFPGQRMAFQAGVWADECNHVYCGGDSGNIHVLFFNGSNFVHYPDIIIGGAAIGKLVHDMRYNSGNNLLYVCGDSFVATVRPVFVCNDTSLDFHFHKTCSAGGNVVWAKLNTPDSTGTYDFEWKDSLTNAVIKTSSNVSNFQDSIHNLLVHHTYQLSIYKDAVCNGFFRQWFFQIDTIDHAYQNRWDTICNNQPLLFYGKTLTQSGVYKDTFINQYGCDSIITLNLKVNPISHYAQQASICANQTYTLPNGKVVHLANTYIDTLPNRFGCDSIIATQLTVFKINHDTIVEAICSNQIYTLPNGSIVNTSGIYIDTFQNHLGCDSIISVLLSVFNSWHDTIRATICNNQTYTLPHGKVVSTSGIYVDTFQNRLGCDSIITVQLAVNAISFFTQNATICKNQFFMLPNGQLVNVANHYSTIITNHAGCDSVVHTVLSVSPIPTIALGNDTTLCKGNVVVLNATSSVASAQYQWNDLSTNPIKTVATAGVYSVQITASPCAPVSDSIKIMYLDCDCQMLMPNAFTPNGDNLDDNIKPIFACDLQPQDYAFKIYNRWGQLLFQTNDYNIAWDGTFIGKPQPIETYIYTIEWKSNQQLKLMKGDVSLLR